MIQVDLIYNRDCPNIAGAREQLLKAFSSLELVPQWTEWLKDDAASPDYIQGYGSPTILINQQDVSGVESEQADQCCRLYQNEHRQLLGIPPLSDIQSALQKGFNAAKSPKSYRSGLFAILPSMGLVVLPKLTCAACWPAYAGLLSAMGVAFFNYTPYLLPLSSVMLLVTLWIFFYHADQRRGLGPFIVGVGASALILIGRFYFQSEAALYIGAGLLTSAAIWNGWPKRNVNCPACVTGETHD